MERLSIKKRCRIRDFETIDGVRLPDFDLGYETWGTLSPERDNVILLCHYFSGTSHAAGKYSPDDAQAGWWDELVGEGCVFDTSKFFVICCDTLINQNLSAIGCPPSTVNPETERPFAADFPSVTMRDFVNAQRQVLLSLGIHELYAVAGPSMGSMQALTWAAAYPERVERVIAVIPAGLSADAYLIERLEQWGAAIRLDAAWQGGNYSSDHRPELGLMFTVRQILLDALHPDCLTPLYGRQRLGDQYLIHHVFAKRAQEVAAQSDPNSILKLIEANQRFDLLDDPKQGNARAIVAPMLFVVAENDLLLYPERALAAANWLRTQGKTVYVFMLTGSRGHLSGVDEISEAAEVMAAFLRDAL